jgi:3-methyladenine DNA glycosylase AlkD
MNATRRRAIVRELDARFRAEGTADRARGSKAYMKSDLAFYGVTSPQVRQAARDVVHANPELDREDAVHLARALFATDNFDLRSGAVAILEKKAHLLEPDDLPALIALVTDASCWAHVDWLATKVFPPPLAKRTTKARADQIRRWAKSPDLWIRRTALLVQHDELKKGGGDFDLFAAIAAPMLEERVFWIRKAIGWILREVSKKRPALVRGFIREHGERMSGLTRREAEKYL